MGVMSSERGMVLLLSLLVVVVLSALAFGAAQQNRLASLRVRSVMDIGMARMAAQRAITSELARLGTLSIASFTAQGHTGLYRADVSTAPPLWTRDSTWQAGRCRLAARTLEHSVAPACTIIELLRYRNAPDYRAFRITARGVGMRPETVIVMQAYSVLESSR
jgi:Tfp pilus assembly protein PilX